MKTYLLVAAGVAAALHALAGTAAPRAGDVARLETTPARHRAMASAAAAAIPRFATVPPEPWAAQDPADSLYQRARRALADQNYGQAAELFGTIVTRYPKSQYAGDALYWRAYALYRGAGAGGSQRDLDRALAALDRQAQEYPNAGTIDDAGGLRAQILSVKASRGDAAAAQDITRRASDLADQKGCPSDDDDERLIALQGLMQMDADQAVPILKQVLARRGACTEKLRQSAVFILSQKRGDEPMRIMLDVARNDPSSEVRGQAIQWLGQSRSELAAAALDSILFTAGDNELREHAVFALSQQRDPRAASALRRFALDDRMPVELRSKAVFWLGQRRGADTDTAFFKELFRKSNDEQMREAIIQAVGNMGGAGETWLLDVARDKSYPIDVRKQAVFWAVQHRGSDLAPIISLYDQTRGETELQKQVLFTLSQRRETAATDKLMEIASKDPDRELRKQAIFWLGQRKDPRIAQFLLDLINK